MVHAKHRFGGAWKKREIRDKVKMWMVGHINDILMCNDLQPWNVIDIIAEGNYRIFPQCRAAINGCAKVDRTTLDYFQLSFPMQLVDDIVTWSSQPSGKPAIC